MQTYFLSVLVPLSPQVGGHVMHVYRIECAASLAWVRQHADELAAQKHGGAYNALMVSETLPDDPRDAYASFVSRRPVLSLRCACCGAYTRGRQWHNRDAGYGLCVDCIPFVSARTDPGEVERCYGIRGLHFDVQA